jgi:hypothetical protein
MFGGAGNDWLVGDAGRDLMCGGEDADMLHGGGGGGDGDDERHPWPDVESTRHAMAYMPWRASRVRRSS